MSTAPLRPRWIPCGIACATAAASVSAVGSEINSAWQIVPRVLVTMLNDPDAARAARVMQVMLTMGKLDIAALEKAFAAA